MSNSDNKYFLGEFVWDPDIGSYILLDSIPVEISDDLFDDLPEFISDFDITDLLNLDEEI